MFRNRHFVALGAGFLFLITLFLHSRGGADALFSSSRQSPVDIQVITPEDAPRPADTSLSTTIPNKAHVHGFTIFDDLYLREGVFYIVTNDPSRFPPKNELLSNGLPLEQPDLEPTDQQLRVISRRQAKVILGDHAMRVVGFTVIFYEPGQFLTHLYHWWGEVILGFWRIYAMLATPTRGVDTLPFPSLFIMPNVVAGYWRDKAGIDGPFMRAAFPDAAIETAEYWADLKKLNTTVVFDRTLLVDRWAAHRHPFGMRWFKMISGVMSVSVPLDFWAPVRASLVSNIVGYSPNVNRNGVVTSPPQAKTTKPVVIYISRQGGGRRLPAADHDRLVESLKELERDGICELHVLMMERMTLAAQMEIVAKSTIMIGVHGNGLTHQLWMPRSRLSAVFEIFFPGSYTFDYEILARNMDHKHYAVHNDTMLTYPKNTYHDGVAFPEGFHGNDIPVYGPAVARAVRARLSGADQD